jgi:glycerophosphoryl diester phosphodiesterase
LRLTDRPPELRQVLESGAEVLLLHWKSAQPALVRRAHQAGLLVIPWTVNSAHQMRHAILAGVDGIVTNCPAKLSETTAALCGALRSRPSETRGTRGRPESVPGQRGRC